MQTINSKDRVTGVASRARKLAGVKLNPTLHHEKDITYISSMEWGVKLWNVAQLGRINLRI